VFYVSNGPNKRCFSTLSHIKWDTVGGCGGVIFAFFIFFLVFCGDSEFCSHENFGENRQGRGNLGGFYELLTRVFCFDPPNYGRNWSTQKSDWPVGIVTANFKDVSPPCFLLLLLRDSYPPTDNPNNCLYFAPVALHPILWPPLFQNFFTSKFFRCFFPYHYA